MSPSIFGQWMLYLPGAIEGLAAVLIGLASLETAVRIAGLFIRRHVTGAAEEEIRFRLGMWLSLALELEIAADILRTTLSPSWDEIGTLARRRRAPNRSELFPPNGDQSGGAQRFRCHPATGWC